MLFLALPIIAINSSEDVASWPDWARPVLMGMVILGIMVLLGAILGSDKTAESWMNAGSQNEASLVLIILAAPLYFLLKLIVWSINSDKRSM